MSMEKFLNLPVVASENGVGTDRLIVYIHWLMIALFVGWLGYFVFTLVRFNRARQPKGDYQGVKSHASSYLELTVAGIEACLLIFVAVPLWARHTAQFPDAKESTVIQVVAQQFAWNFRYPGRDGAFGRQDMNLVTADNVFGVDPADPAGQDDVQVLNEIHVPVNKPVIVYISSKDVIHSFRVMAMRVTQDAIPGMRVPIWFKPVKAGHYQIQCAQLCGNGHASMAGGMLVVESQEACDRWLAAKTGGATSFE
jgi:cytochrome c oxidase subunit II